MPFVIHVSALVRRDSQILLVQEGKTACYGQWNLPGGHLESGERLLDGLRRELLEETGLQITVQHLIGIYTGLADDHHLLNLVSAATAEPGEARPQADDVLACQWYEFDQILALPEKHLRNPTKLRTILNDAQQGAFLSLTNLHEWVYPEQFIPQPSMQ